MSEIKAVTTRKKKPNALWWVVGLLILLFAWFFYQLFGPNPAIVVSKETTYITEPLRADGMPDYEKYMLELFRKGVSPEDNAAVLMFKALGKGDLSPQDYSLISREIGLHDDVSNVPLISPLYGTNNRARVAEWLQETAKAAGSDASSNAATAAPSPYATSDDIAVQAIASAQSRPWTGSQFPPLAQWIDENSASIDLLADACNRPRFYAPDANLLNAETNLLTTSLAAIQLAREATYVLSIRAMFQLGESRPDKAWRDIRAIHKLARSLAQTPTLVDRMTGIAISGIADDLTVTLLDKGNLSRQQAVGVQNELAQFRKSDVFRDIHVVERLFGLEMFVQARSTGPGTILSSTRWLSVGNEEDEWIYEALNLVSIDWNIVLRDWNRWYDKLAAATEISDRAARNAALARINGELSVLNDQLTERHRWIGGALNRAQRSKMVAGAVANAFLSGVMSSSQAEERANRSLALLRVAAALAVHRADDGSYPAKLNLLQAANELPNDPHSNMPFLYGRVANGYLLYSVGKNGVDDGGSNEELKAFEGLFLDEFDSTVADSLREKIPKGADDYAIRVPRPAFKLPKLPASSNAR